MVGHSQLLGEPGEGFLFEEDHPPMYLERDLLRLGAHFVTDPEELAALNLTREQAYQVILKFLVYLGKQEMMEFLEELEQRNAGR